MKFPIPRKARLCTICGKPIVLFPSAEERARKFGGKPLDYTTMFDAHSQCTIDKRKADTLEVIRRNHTDLYACKDLHDMWTIRQERYRYRLAPGAGGEHPHDVMATAHSLEQLRAMQVHFPDVDFDNYHTR